MRCVICDHDEWENVDQYRLKKEGMAICKHCGFISYPSKWKTEEELVEYYRKEYRPGPKIQNWWSGQRKLHFHNAFLQPVFEKWRKENIKPVVGEIGAAYGLFLNFIREVCPGAEVYGTELTLSYRRNAFHQFGIELSEEFDYSKKYDLIASYKVAEHQFDIDKMLLKYKECLKENGFLYISVPTWFNKLYNFGAGGFDIEYYFHPNHINVWTRKHFEMLLRKCGFKVVMFNETFYDDTFLCVRDDSQMAGPFEYESYETMIERLKAVKAAGTAFMEGRFKEATDVWPYFPDAYIGFYEHNRTKIRGEELAAFVEKARKECKDSPEILGMAGDLAMRFEKYNDAIKLFEQLLALRPGFSAAFKGISHSFRQLGHKALRDGRHQEGIEHLKKAREVMAYLRQVSDQDIPEATNWIFDDNSRIPMPSELK